MYQGITGGIEVLVHLIYAQDNCSNIAYRVYDNDELIINRGISNKRDAKIPRLQLLFRYAIGLALILSSLNFSVNRRGR